MIFEDPKEAAEAIKKGEIVLFPTETVWGMGADAKNEEACEKVYEIKGRPKDNPLIIHLHSLEQIALVGEIDPKLLQRCTEWMPGPLTLILKKKDKSVFSCGLDTVGVRIPDHDIAREMIRLSDTFVAAPSANVSGRPSITRFKDVVETFDALNVLRGEDPRLGLESTVIDLTKKSPVYVRPGMITFEELQETFPDLKKVEGVQEKPISPGMKYRHYAPKCQVILVDNLDGVKEEGAGQLGFSPNETSLHSVKVADNQEYAKELYAFLIECDRKGVKRAYCQLPKEGPLYYTLMHRLEKASHLKN